MGVAFGGMLSMKGNFLCRCLVNLDGAVDSPHKPVSGAKADGTGGNPEDKHHNQAIAKVKNGGHGVINLEFGQEVKHTVQKHINGCTPRHDKGAPPPVIVLGTTSTCAR